jgi:hypothetical protein
MALMWRRLSPDEALRAATATEEARAQREGTFRASPDDGEPIDAPDPNAVAREDAVSTRLRAAASKPLLRATVPPKAVEAPPVRHAATSLDDGCARLSQDDGEHTTTSRWATQSLAPLPPRTQAPVFAPVFRWVPGGIEYAGRPAEGEPYSSAVGDVGGVGFMGIRSIFPERWPSADPAVSWATATAGMYAPSPSISGSPQRERSTMRKTAIDRFAPAALCL